MYACLECGQRLPPRSKGGHRERNYCSTTCRQRAYRTARKQKQESDRLIEGVYALPEKDPLVSRDAWRSERARLLHKINLLELERTSAESEVQMLTTRNKQLEAMTRNLEQLLADSDSEIIRLTMLLDSQSKRKR
jgi:hypothetical protein